MDAEGKDLGCALHWEFSLRHRAIFMTRIMELEAVRKIGARLIKVF
jgi:hypothetical protein